jgi:hypothetical protein
VTRYPNFAVNGWFKIRVNRLLLILRDGPLDVPPEEGETFPRWLRRANRFYKFRQSAHSCDNCECVNLGHLEWKTQAENLQEQADRKRAGESREEGHAA